MHILIMFSGPRKVMHHRKLGQVNLQSVGFGIFHPSISFQQVPTIKKGILVIPLSCPSIALRLP